MSGSQKILVCVCAVYDLGQATWDGKHLYELFTNRYRHMERLVLEITQLMAPEPHFEPGVFLILGQDILILHHSQPFLSLISEMTGSEYSPFQLKRFNVHRKSPLPHHSWCITGPRVGMHALFVRCQPSPGDGAPCRGLERAPGLPRAI